MVTSMVFLSPGVTMLAYGNHLWIKGIGVFLLLLGMALILFGAYQLLDGAAGGFRIPGLSTLDVYGTKDERKDMESAVVALRRQAIQLPNSLPTVVDNNDLEDE